MKSLLEDLQPCPRSERVTRADVRKQRGHAHISSVRG